MIPNLSRRRVLRETAMAASPLLLFTTIILHQISAFRAFPQNSKDFLPSLVESPSSESVFFEVSRPIQAPNKGPPCSSLVLQHDFGYTYGRPPVETQYAPPQNCPSLDWSLVVLEWSATIKGTQYDRIFGVWLSGVEILRSCTAEPRTTGISWKVEKDITKFSSLLRKNQTLSVYLGNLVNNIYTGVYHAKLIFHFYPKLEVGKRVWNLGFGLDVPADLVLPISRTTPLVDGYWFVIPNSDGVQQKQIKIPPNSIRASLEIYVSFHSRDEFWYSNPPNEYITMNNLTGIGGNGAFREVVVSLDGRVVGAVSPLTVVYTGGFNPLLWRPISGIGSFNLPSYDVEITSFLGEILDLNDHIIKFEVTDALNMWYVDANLHIWLDSSQGNTMGQLVSYDAQHTGPNVKMNYKGVDGSFDTDGGRYVTATGWVNSSSGNLTINMNQRFGVRNSLVFRNGGNSLFVNQTTHSYYYVSFSLPTSDLFSIQENRTYVLNLRQDVMYRGGLRVDTTNVSLGIVQNCCKRGGNDPTSYVLENSQDGSAYLLIRGNSLVGAVGTTKQVYRYHGSDGCYARNVSSSNYTILYDQSSNLCHKGGP